MAWEVDPRSDDDTIIIKRVATGGGIGLIIFFYIIGQIFQWVSENWIYIVIILGIAIVSTIVCFVIHVKSQSPGSKIFITIVASIGLIIGVIYFGPKIKDGTLYEGNKMSSQTTTKNSVSSQELIGARLKYEVVSARTGNCSVRITDIYDTNWVYYFVVRHNINDIYDIYAYGGDKKVGTANLYTEEFTGLIINYIRTTSEQLGGHSEWKTYASTIAEKIEELMKSQHRL